MSGTVARTGDRATAAAVVEQRVDGLLEHPLLVVHDDLGCPEVEQALEAVVPVDDPSVQVVEVGGGEATAVELHHRAQLRRDHRDDVEDHGARVVDAAPVVVTTVERRHDLQALDGLLLALRRERLLALGRVDLGAQDDLVGIEVDAVDETGDGIGAHAPLEVLAVAILQLAPQHLVLDDLAGEEVLELLEGAGDEVELHLVALANRLQVLLAGPLARLDVGVLGPLGLELAQFGFQRLETLGQLDLTLLFDDVALGEHLGLEVRQLVVATVVVDPGDEVGGEVDDLLELLGLQLLAGLGAHEQVGQPRTGAAEVPDVHDGSGQLDVAHALAPDLRTGDLDAAALADDALEAHALVLAAVALPVLGRTEDLLAEETVLLRLEGAVVDGLRLLDLTVGPRADRVGGGQTDPELIEVVDVEHGHSFSSSRPGGGRLLRRCPAQGVRCRCRAPRRYGRCLRRAHASRSPHRWWRGPRR